MATPYAFDEPTARKILRNLRGARYVNNAPGMYPQRRRIPRSAGGESEPLLAGYLNMVSKQFAGIRGNPNNAINGTDNAQTDRVILDNDDEIEATNRTGRYVYDGSRVMVLARDNAETGERENSIITTNSADVILAKATQNWPSTSSSQAFSAIHSGGLNGYPSHTGNPPYGPSGDTITVDYNPSGESALDPEELSWGSINDKVICTVNALGQYDLVCRQSVTPTYWATATLATDITTSGNGSTSGTCTVRGITGIGVNRSTSASTQSTAFNPWGCVGDAGDHCLGYVSISSTGVETFTLTQTSRYNFTSAGNTYSAPRYTP